MRTIQRRLDKVNVVKPAITNSQNNPVGLIMDTTYFGRDFGVMVFMDNVSGRVLHYAFVKHETNDLYRIGIHAIKDKFALHSITCDGRRGLLGGLGTYPHKCATFIKLPLFGVI